MDRLARRRYLILGFFALAIAFLFSALGSFVERSHRNRFDLGQTYTKALSATFSSLSSISSDLKADGSLHQNINWQLTNSIKQSFSSLLAVGSVDAIFLHDSQCRLVSKAKTNKHLEAICNDPQENGFSWIKHNENTILALKQPLSTGFENHYLLSIFVVLDKDWLSLQSSRLGSAASNLQIAKEKPRGSFLVFKNGAEGRQASLANLWLLDPYEKPVAYLSKIVDRPNNAYFWLFGLFALICFPMQLVVELAEQKKSRLKDQAFVAWAKNLLPKDTSQHFKAKERPLPHLEQAKVYIKQALTLENRKYCKVQKDYALKVQKINSLEKKLKSNDKRLEDLSLQLSLSMQWTKNIEKLAFQSKKFVDESQTTNDIQSEINRNIYRLGDIFYNWKEGIQKRSARKFLRSLSETLDENGEDLLNQQIKTIYKILTEISDQAIASSVSLKKISSDANQINEYTEFWSLIQKEHEQPKLLASDQLSTTKMLFEQLTRLNYPNVKLSGLEDIKDMPPVTLDVLLSTTFHIFGLLVGRRNDQVNISLAGRRQSKEYMMAFSAPASKDDNQTKNFKKLDESLINSLISQSPLKYKILPVIEGQQTAILSWDQTFSTSHSSSL